MTSAACLGEPSLTIRQIAEHEVIRMRQGGVARAAQAILVQKDEAVMVHTTEWRVEATRRIIEGCHRPKMPHPAG